MYFKLAFRNIKKSLKDYAIYFLTLVLGVCIFYTFNSIESQSIMMELSDLKANAFELTSDIIGIVSIFISFNKMSQNRNGILLHEKKIA